MISKLDVNPPMENTGETRTKFSKLNCSSFPFSLSVTHSLNLGTDNREREDMDWQPKENSRYRGEGKRKWVKYNCSAMDLVYLLILEIHVLQFWE